MKIGDRVEYTGMLVPSNHGRKGEITLIQSGYFYVKFDGDGFSVPCYDTNLVLIEPPVTEQPITIELTGPDWEPTAATRWYAQRGEGTFDFGPTPEAALAALLKREKLTK